MADGISIRAIKADQIAEIEPEIALIFQKFEGKFPDEKTWQELRPEIFDRQYQLWAVLSGDDIIAVSLTFIKNDARKTCVISHCAGRDFEQWADQLLTTIRVWSFSLGSTKLQIVARPGWQRVLKPLGMVAKQVILELKENG